MSLSSQALRHPIGALIRSARIVEADFSVQDRLV